MSDDRTESHEFANELAVSFLQGLGSSFVKFFAVVTYILYFLRTFVPGASGGMVWLVLLLSTAGLWWAIDFAMQFLAKKLRPSP
ncbi:hypothetical protein HME9302_00090 [Alteripontixanthobacter maritimus]|uniref:Uncharacterized protein n=1 Tax=Alteripontixanthobacter maritimus TaxID=2161824 RepID=A0A369Q2C1_9SPHN|nr:hypothetical protein [Alteripontixanthobacter maritimus]RDC58914.1 hypothetical protein HME9302_00090 [Alteripontixanthobacter maritimus]